MGNIKNIKSLVAFILVSQLAGAIGSLFTFDAIPTWYATLNKPSFSPPNFLFGPVWLTLYTLMGISTYLIWKKQKGKKVSFEIKFFLFHLVINSLWSILFFGLKNPGLAFVEIVFLWTLIVTLIIKYAKINKVASLLLIPYLLWVTFASALNYSIWMLNR